MIERICNILGLVLLSIMAMGCKQQDTSGAPVAESDLSLRLDSVARTFLSHGETIGFSIAVLAEGDTLYNKGFGYTDTLHEKLVNTNTVFNLASISKLVGSIMILKLVEKGVLSLDQTLGELIPDYPNAMQASKIELRHLISMTSGLKEYAPHFDSLYINEGTSPKDRDVVDFLARNALDFEPGTFYRYCNSGFKLLPQIMELATGVRFEDLIDTLINVPANMNFRLMADRYNHDARLTQFFEIKEDSIVHRDPWLWLRGDGGLTTSAIDLVHLPFFLRDNIFISDSLLKLMIARTELGNGLTSGYGLGVKSGSFLGAPLWGHSGADKTYWSMVYFFPEEEVSIVTLVNTNNTFYDAKELFIQVAQEVLARYIPDYESNEESSENLSDYTGTYFRYNDSPDEEVVILLSEEDQHLYYQFGNGGMGMEKMYYGGNDDFYIEKWPADRVHFVRGKDGKVLALEEYYAGYFSQLRKKRSQ